MIDKLIAASIRNKLMVILGIIAWIGWGIYSLLQIPVGAVPDVTNNQVQVITTSRNLSTEDVERFITYPVELSMANLPGVQEIRSVSKFGLSVVTVVFDEEMGTYLPRQLIAEKLKEAEEVIPANFGRPFMGPVSTGLGEIYQYVLDVKPGYEDRYTAEDLRTIQDWIVKRQLSGIPGVVEVNTWGGFLKQYEVAIDPDRLRALDVSLTEVFAALSQNNSVVGGGYIERGPQSYFVRGEGQIRSREEIEQVVVARRAGRPILVRDLGTVVFGHATRFGAITGNGEGEKVLGQVMMLKGANSNEVIEAVKERVAQVQPTLPEGIFINPFLERTELIEKTTATVEENLILGALIVIFVVVLLLGNLRSGLVVASVIPLALLFGLSMMNLFGVSANLMSLGAIDFGIIIDGAVIIVEFVVHQLTHRSRQWGRLDPEDRRAVQDDLVYESSSRMMRAAIFGQVIILIVFIPILSLSGVEGKMFRPMAMSFSFALLGAMILCLTYVPVMSAIFLRAPKPDAWILRFSDRLVAWIDRLYTPFLLMALRFRYLTLGLAGAMLVGAVVLFLRMGGEFVPTLDEGDLVIQPILKPGTSLAQTVALNTRIEQILLADFPEVSQVVSRIGAAEVPTDPMSMEMSDIIVRLRPRAEWVRATDKEDLTNQIKTALQVIPGMEYEFTQPIEMRFNELITGVRADLAIKVFGEDLDTLFVKANAIKRLIGDVEGAADITVEQIAGLPQMTVSYDRGMIAKYGLDIAELNQLIEMGFAGAATGVVFEGERRFDLVVRLNKDRRQDIEDIRNLRLRTADGRTVPLREVADISYQYGPAQISRDDTRRRIVVGINVRNRDLQSMVEEIQGILDRELTLPEGYYLDYGGQFENLQAAKGRLAIAVPIALILILILLHFTFQSFKQALMVYSAIPLSAIGGVLLLWLRDLPFSISAGVGFIALFGIAVLNGIVLISHFNEMKAEGSQSVLRRVIVGTRDRLRPVLLTASAAALGFFPMALSSSSGAEVQRPLATVVIGGLVTATMLTLIVLPVLYTLFERGPARRRRASASTPIVVGLLFLLAWAGPAGLQAQDRPVTERIDLEAAVSQALTHNRLIQAGETAVAAATAREGMAWDIPATSFYQGIDQNNLAPNDRPLSVWGIQQSLALPGYYRRQGEVWRAATQVEEAAQAERIYALSRAVAQAYLDVVYARHRWQEWRRLDSLYQGFGEIAARRLSVGESGKLALLTARTRREEVAMQLRQATVDLDEAYARLKQWVQSSGPFQVADSVMWRMSPPAAQAAGNPSLLRLGALGAQAEAEVRLEQSRRWPDLQFEYFYGFGQGENARNFPGYQVGLSLPLWPRARQAAVASSRLAVVQQQRLAEDYRYRLTAEQERLRAQLDRYAEALAYYEQEALPLATEMVRMAGQAYRQGEADYLAYLQSLEAARSMRRNWLEQLYLYNQTVISLRYVGI